jgi:hypothetical protein
MKRVEHPRGGASKPAATAQQRHAQRQLISLLDLADVELDTRGANLRLTQESTELPTWLDILGVPYQVLTVRHGSPRRPGPLDVLILVTWSDFPALTRWAPGGAGRIEALRSMRPATQEQPRPSGGW